MIKKLHWNRMILEYNDELFDGKKKVLIVHHFTKRNGFWYQCFDFGNFTWPFNNLVCAWYQRKFFKDITPEFCQRYH